MKIIDTYFIPIVSTVCIILLIALAYNRIVVIPRYTDQKNESIKKDHNDFITQCLDDKFTQTECSLMYSQMVSQ